MLTISALYGPTYTVTEEPLGTPNPTHSRYSGWSWCKRLNRARHMDLHMTNFELTVYEKNSVVGGTWFENRRAFDYTQASCPKCYAPLILMTRA